MKAKQAAEDAQKMLEALKGREGSTAPSEAPNRAQPESVNATPAPDEGVYAGHCLLSVHIPRAKHEASRHLTLRCAISPDSSKPVFTRIGTGKLRGVTCFPA